MNFISIGRDCVKKFADGSMVCKSLTHYIYCTQKGGERPMCAISKISTKDIKCLEKDKHVIYNDNGFMITTNSWMLGWCIYMSPELSDGTSGIRRVDDNSDYILDPAGNFHERTAHRI